MVAALAHQHLSDRAIGDCFFGFVPLVGRRGLRAHLEHALGLLHRRRELLGLLDGVAHRLLDVDILTVIHRLHCNLSVPMVGRRNEHGVDIGPAEDLPVVERHVAFMRFGIGPSALAIHVAHGDNLAAVGTFADSGELSGEITTASADADCADINTVIRADDAARLGWTSRQGSARYAQHSAGLGRSFHKLSSVDGVLVHGIPRLNDKIRLFRLYTRLRPE